MTTDNRTRRRRNWLLIGAVLFIMVVAQLSGAPERLPTPYFDLPRPMVIAHQGGNLLRPGDTLLAFDHALALGVDVLEMDLHLSADDHVVVIHDATVERTTNGRGEVRSLDLASLQALDAAYHWPLDSLQKTYRGQGVRIPTLLEVLVRYPQQRLLLELKTADPALADTVCGLLMTHEHEPLALVASFHHEALTRFRSQCPAVATSASADEVDSFMLLRNMGLLRFYIAPALALQVAQRRDDKDLLVAEVVRDANEWHLHVDYWTLNNPADMRKAIDIRAQGIITDRPDVLLDELGRI